MVYSVGGWFLKGTLLVGMAICLLIPLAAPALAQPTNPIATAEPTRTSSGLPSLEDATQKLAGIADSTEIPAEIKPGLTEQMTKVVESLKTLADVRSRTKKLEEQVLAVPDDLKAARKDIERSAPPVPRVADSEPLDKVRSRKGEKDTELATAKAQKAELSSRFENRKSRRTQATDMVTALRTELQKLESEVPVADPDSKNDPRLMVAQQWDRAARLELVRSRLALEQQIQRTIEAEEELLPLQIQLSERDVARLEKEVAIFTQAVSSRRENKVEEALKAHREALLNESKDPESSKVLELGPDWIDVVRMHGDAEKEKTAIALQSENLSQELTSTDKTISDDIKNNGSLRSGLGLKLQRQRSKLPEDAGLRGKILLVDRRIEEMGVAAGASRNANRRLKRLRINRSTTHGCRRSPDGSLGSRSHARI